MNSRILIVEDDADILDILKFALDQTNFEVIALTNFPTVQEIGKMKPDLILLDIRVVGSDKMGNELCRELKSTAITQHLPVLLLSAEHGLPQLAHNCGADGYIPKPFDIDTMVARLSQQLSLSRSTNQ